MKKYLKDSLSFSKKELNGLFIFCLLLILIQLFPFLYLWVSPSLNYDHSASLKEVEEFLASAQSSQEQKQWQYEKKKTSNPKALFEFNPNNLPEEKWKELGLSDRQIKIIKNYEAKGGRFFKKEDLRKIYSISEELYVKLSPFIAIPENEKAAFNQAKSFKVTKVELININTADSSALETLKGIGPKFSSRIVKYRERLGGFYKKDQLLEVYGIDSSLFVALKEKIILNEKDIVLIPINKVSFDDLKRHPYLNYKQINAIIQYRKQHGNYSSVDDLKQVLLLKEEILRKIEPYLDFNDK